MCDPDDSDEARISVPRDGYPSLVFVEFAPRGEWKATVLTHHSGDSLANLDRRARGVLRAYANDLLVRLNEMDVYNATTLNLPSGSFRLDLGED